MCHRDVRLPGKDINSPEVFAFGTPYRYILDSLKSKDEEFFRKNKLLGLVARNAEIKTAPQRFQEIEGSEVAEFDVVLCFDSRVFYLVVEGTFTAYDNTITILTNLPPSPFSRTSLLMELPHLMGVSVGTRHRRASLCRKHTFCPSQYSPGVKIIRTTVSWKWNLKVKVLCILKHLVWQCEFLRLHILPMHSSSAS